MYKRNLYNGTEFKTQNFTSFLEIFEKRSSSEKEYLKFYKNGRFVSSYSFKKICLMAKERAKYIEKLNLKEKKIILKLGNSPELISWYLACFINQTVSVPVSPLESEEYVELIKEKFDIQHVIDIENLEFLDTNFENIKPNQKGTSIIFTTSGTTGESKGVRLSLENLLSNAVATQKAHELNSDTIHMCVLPLVHVNAFHFSFFTSFFVGHSLILCDSFFLPNFWDIVRDEAVQIVSLVPTLISFLNQHSKRLQDFKTPKTLKYIVSAASALSYQCFKDFYEFYKLRIIQSYGLSETVNFSLITPINLSQEEYLFLYDRKIPTVGVEVYGNHVNLMDENNRIIDQENTVGELVIQGWNVSLGHIPQTSTNPFKYRFFHSGDLGYFITFNGKRYFFLTGRIKEIIKIDGHTLSPSLLEAEYKNILSIDQIAVTSIKNENKEELVFTYKGDLNLEETKKILNSKLPYYKRPKLYVLIEDIPITSTGKIKRKELRDILEKFR